MRLVKLLTIAALLATIANAAALRAVPEVLPDESGVTSLTLTVDAARITIPDTVDFSTRAYFYDGIPQLSGPNIILTAGGRLNLTLVNNLVDDSALDATRAINTFRHANTTNLHTHGLHVDPAIDSIFRHASPGGGSVHYDLPIPANHAPGMHWYHSHTHGSSMMHIMGGLVGPMYVQWLPRDNVPAAITGLQSHVLVLQLLNFAAETRDGVVTQSCSRDQPGFDPFKTYSFGELESESGSLLESNPTYYTTDRVFFTINGQHRPTITMAPGESRLFKLVYAAGSKSPALIFPSGCTAENIAFDGVYFDGAPRTVSYLQLVVASRVEFVMTCASAGTHTVNVVTNGDINNMRFTGGSALFHLLVTGSSQTPAPLPASLGITRPSYLTDLRGLSSIDTLNQVSLAQGGSEDCKFHIGIGSDCSTPAGPRPRQQASCAFNEFSGQKGTTDPSRYAFTMRVGQTSEWQLHGAGAVPHPLHIHVNHYQVRSYSGSSDVLAPWMQPGDWRDTIPLLSGTITVRFVADALSGETVLHCHELSHEDKGLMGTFLIMPADGATTTAAISSTTTSAPPPPTTTANAPLDDAVNETPTATPSAAIGLQLHVFAWACVAVFATAMLTHL